MFDQVQFATRHQYPTYIMKTTFFTLCIGLVCSANAQDAIDDSKLSTTADLLRGFNDKELAEARRAITTRREPTLGLARPRLVTATGHVYEDRNANGRRDDGESALPNVMVSDGEKVVRTGDDDVYTFEPMLKVADAIGIERCKPVYRSSAKRRVTHGPFVGHITSSTVMVWARCSRPGKYHLSARSNDGVQVKTDGESSTEHDGCVVWRLESLRPATRYRYAIEFGDERLVEGDAYFFTTAPTHRLATVRLGFASCANEDEGTEAVWNQMREADPHAVVLLGDTPYIDSTDLAVQRRRHGEFAAAAGFRKLVRNRSLYATWDDHDFGRNDTDGNLKGKENSRRAFMEYRANPSYGDSKAGIYTKFRRGGVEVFLLDTRFFAATEPSPFDKDRPTLLGAEQWKWLRRELKASTAPFKVLACGMIWNAAVRPGKKDHWGTYLHERDALFNLIGKEKITGVVLVGGDIHRTRVLRYETTKQVGYDIPELITSPAHASVIANANVPHPALVHDSGVPNTFLLISVNTHDDPATLTAKFLNKDGRSLFEAKFTEQDLRRQN